MRPIGLIGLIAMLTLPALGATIAWDGSPGAAGYRVYQGVASRIYTNVIDAGTNTTLRLALPAGTNFIAITAYNVQGRESAYSEELSTSVPAPLTLRVEASEQLTGSWTSLFNTLVTNNGRQMFFRMSLK